MGRRHRGDDGQAETGSSTPRAGASVSVKHRGESIGSRAGAGISDPQQCSIVPLLHLDLDSSSLRRVSQSVVDEVGNRSLDRARVAFDVALT